MKKYPGYPIICVGAFLLLGFSLYVVSVALIEFAWSINTTFLCQQQGCSVGVNEINMILSMLCIFLVAPSIAAAGLPFTRYVLRRLSKHEYHRHNWWGPSNLAMYASGTFIAACGVLLLFVEFNHIVNSVATAYGQHIRLMSHSQEMGGFIAAALLIVAGIVTASWPFQKWWQSEETLSQILGNEA